MVVDLSKLKDAPEFASPDSPNHINIAFRNDRDFDGARFDIKDVSPEQIGAAILRLQHVAFMLIGAQQQQMLSAQQQAESVREALAREKGN